MWAQSQPPQQSSVRIQPSERPGLAPKQQPNADLQCPNNEKANSSQASISSQLLKKLDEQIHRSNQKLCHFQLEEQGKDGPQQEAKDTLLQISPDSYSQEQPRNDQDSVSTTRFELCD